MVKCELISVVEDDQPFRESMRKLMMSLGYAVEAFASAADFLASPCLAATACLISDVQMPGMTGVELHKRLLDMGHRIPTILVTAYPDEFTRTRAMRERDRLLSRQARGRRPPRALSSSGSRNPGSRMVRELMNLPAPVGRVS